MSNNDRLEEHVDTKTSKTYFTTTDASGKHMLSVDQEDAHLLRDTTWRVTKVYKDPTKLHARAVSKAPGIKRGACLHRLALKSRRDRHVRALDGNLLNARRSNLQSLKRGDVRILSKARPATKLVGVRFHSIPRWLKSERNWQATVRHNKKALYLGSFRTAEEAACAADKATRLLYGETAVTNRSLGLISEAVVRTKVCRLAARVARDRIREYKDKIAVKKYTAWKANPTRENFLAFLRQPSTQPRVVIKSFADADVELETTNATAP